MTGPTVNHQIDGAAQKCLILNLKDIVSSVVNLVWHSIIRIRQDTAKSASAELLKFLERDVSRTEVMKGLMYNQKLGFDVWVLKPTSTLRMHSITDTNMSFLSTKNILSTHSKAAHNTSTSPYDSFKSLTDIINGDPAHVWTSVELHDHYTNICDDAKITTRKQLVGKLQSHSGETLVKFDISGCASLFCFKDHLPKIIRLVRIDDDGSNIIDNWKDTIVSECKVLLKSNDYISQFRQSCTLTNTSLLTCIAKIYQMAKAPEHPLHWHNAFIRPHHTIIQPNQLRSCCKITPQLWIKETFDNSTCIWNHCYI